MPSLYLDAREYLTCIGFLMNDLMPIPADDQAESTCNDLVKATCESINAGLLEDEARSEFYLSRKAFLTDYGHTCPVCLLSDLARVMVRDWLTTRDCTEITDMIRDLDVIK
ncbi:hypothetical protein GCG54_00010781 [Colletotrichum gloeosporioides]|uniref:Uncharacterized protein n=1 Tax=Colletotrichum gloeosporioides TaxID=474922 RepID=A0A8H4C726_COLGL|nr:uncharacterized protein GCG54_00010781 [Colletotrichum gloeosporioides]KAF3798628.1 hypothetical protein GCG54_00010781 [Colletotrichum gloeosporioides]